MLTLTEQELEHRAARLAGLCPRELRPALEPGESAAGGGSFPGAVLPTTLVALDPGSSERTDSRSVSGWRGHPWWRGWVAGACCSTPGPYRRTPFRS